MWDFHHPPLQAALVERYELHLTEPAQCARELLEGRADLGLIPIAALTPELRIVPGCAIASLGKVRSIQLIVKAPLGFGIVCGLRRSSCRTGRMPRRCLRKPMRRC
jgi:chorismate dehydratase